MISHPINYNFNNPIVIYGNKNFSNLDEDTVNVIF